MAIQDGKKGRADEERGSIRIAASRPGSSRPSLATRALAIALAAGLVSAAQSAPRAADPQPPPSAPDDAVLGGRLAERYAEIAELRNAELEDRLAELWASDPEAAFDALALRAGRETPPILSGPRRAAREALRAEAVQWIAALIEQREERERCITRLSRAMREPDGTALACAATRLVGELRIYELARDVAANLCADDPELRNAARSALFALYLRWFDGPEAFEQFAARLGATSILLDASTHYEQRARELLTQLVELDAGRAAAALDEPDPRIRAAAARALARAASSGRLHEDDVIALLLPRLAVEEDALAFQALAEGLVEALADALPEAPAVREAREALSAVVDAGHPGLQASAAHAISRLPWDLIDSHARSSVMRGIESLAARFGARMEEGELADPDVLVILLRSLQTLCSRARGAGIDLSGRESGLRARVLQLFEDPHALERVRIAAALLLPAIARPEDAVTVLAVLRSEGTRAELAYAAVTALGEMARDLDASDPMMPAVLEGLAREVAGGSPDLRRRALGFLVGAPLAERVAAEDPGLFVDWLGGETLPELQSSLLSLTAKHCGPAELDRVLALERFDAIVGSAPGRVGEMYAALDQLARGDSDRIFDVAQRMVAVADETTEVRRLQLALERASAFALDVASALAPDRHREIVRWARRFRAAGGSTAAISVPGRAFLERLVRLHIPGAKGAGSEPAGADAYASALFLADLWAADPTAAEPAEVEQAFHEALAQAEVLGDRLALDPARVRRARARFRQATGNEPLALADYRAVIEIDRERPVEPSGEGSRPVLELSDLRVAAALSAKLSEDIALLDRPAPAEAFELTSMLMARPSWGDEAVALRMQDARDLALRAVRTQDAERVRRAAERFAALPAPLAEVGGALSDPTALQSSIELGIFAGLADEPARLEELQGLRAMLDEAEQGLRGTAREPAEPGRERDGGAAGGDDGGLAPNERAANGGGDPDTSPRKPRRGA